MHEGNEFRHFGHFDLVRHISTSAAADNQTAEYIDQTVGVFAREFVDQCASGQGRNRHTGHTEYIAADRSGRVAKTLKCLNKADRGQQIQQGDKIHGHGEYLFVFLITIYLVASQAGLTA